MIGDAPGLLLHKLLVIQGHWMEPATYSPAHPGDAREEHDECEQEGAAPCDEPQELRWSQMDRAALTEQLPGILPKPGWKVGAVSLHQHGHAHQHEQTQHERQTEFAAT